MKRICRIGLVAVSSSLAAFALLLGSAAAQAPAGTTALVGATLISPGSSPIPDAIVVVRDGRIVCAAARSACRVPDDARSIDVSGAFITPGLIDAHVHYSQTGWVDGRPDAFDVRDELPYDSTVFALKRHPERFHRAALCSGVTSVFDVGGYFWTFDIARASRSATNAPRVVAAGPLLSTIDHWVNLPAIQQFTFMSSDSIVRAAISAQAQAGAEAVKVWYINLPDSLRAQKRPLLELAADEAERAGLPLLVHATELHTAKEALAAGAKVLVHSVDSDTVDAEFIELARRNGAVVIPTLTVVEGYADVYLGRSPAHRYPLECVDPVTRSKLERVLPEERRGRAIAYFQSGVLERERATMEENLRRLHAAGIPIAMGTDAGNPGTAHGPSVYREMEALAKAGLSPDDVLASSTIVAARAMGIDDETGSLEPGKVADLVVVGADPLADVRAYRKVRFVMRNGVLHRRSDLSPDR